jgi:Spy/CpxP family protein refolding chaperone
MGIKSKTILAMSALAVCATLAFAQSSTQAPPPPQQGQDQGQGMRRQGPPPGGRGMMGQSMNGEMGNGMRGRMMRVHRRRAMRRRMIRRHMRNGVAFGRGPMGMQPGMDRGMGPGMGQGMGRGMGTGMGMGRGMGQGMGPGRGAGLTHLVNDPAMRERLGITSEQAAKITSQQTEFQKAGVQNRATLEIKHMELQQLMSSDKPDRAAVDKKLAEISAAQLAQQQTNVHHQLDMKTALTPDQQAKLHQWMESEHPGMGPGGPQGMGRGGRGGRGPQPPPPPAKQPGGEPGMPGGVIN